MNSLKCTFLVLILVVREILTLSYSTSKTTGMVGFAKRAGVSGGWSGSVVEINTLQDFIQNVGDSTTRVLVINSDIKASNLTKVNLGSHKSIIGSFRRPILYNIYLQATDATKNIIFQNLIFQHAVENSAIDNIQLNLNYGSKYWIDHCSFVGHTPSPEDESTDRLLYIGEMADYATISNCLFRNHKHGLIFGYPEDTDNRALDGPLHVTICNNRFENVQIRAPGLIHYGYFHVYSNYVSGFYIAFALATKGKVISENNYLSNGTQPYHVTLDDHGTGTFTDTGSIPALTNQKSPKSSWSVSSYYKYKAITAEEAVDFTTKNAGAQSSALVFGT